MRPLRFLAAAVLCALGLVLPYKARARYLVLVAAAIHLPYAWFGRLSRLLLLRLGLDNPYERVDTWH